MQWKAQHEFARADGQLRVIDAKKNSVTHKDETRRNSRAWLEAKKVVDEEAKAAGIEEESQWYYNATPADVELS